MTKNGIGRSVAMQALKIAEEQGAFTVFALVDALTRIAREEEFAGDRMEADQKASSLLSLVTA